MKEIKRKFFDKKSQDGTRDWKQMEKTNDMTIPPIIIVGAGLFGATLAERITTCLEHPVTIIDRRQHIAGNCWSDIAPGTDIERHVYGSHIFHTSDDGVWDHVCRFSAFNSYRHTVYTTYQDTVYPMPINLGTINAFYGTRLRPADVEDFLRKEAGDVPDPKNLEEKAISLIGRPLYEAFIKGYTWKQWDKDPRELSADIITRLPVRASYNNRYFSDTHEGIPLCGYGTLVRRMLASPLITIHLGVSFDEYRPSLPADSLIIYTGPIDEFFGWELGRLEWRTVDLEWETLPLRDHQGTAVMNYADTEIPWTRIHEFKHYHPERTRVMAAPQTVIAREFSRAAKQSDEPYYPVDTEANRTLFQRYTELATQTVLPKGMEVIFGGRLGQYRYLDMDTTIRSALDLFDELVVHLRPNACNIVE